MKKARQFKSLIVLNEILTNHLKSIQSAKSAGQRVAYVSVGFPVEILLSFDIVPVCIQTHAAIIGALRRSKPVLEEIEGHWGYAVDLCSEIKISLGIGLSGEKIEGYAIPRPDLVVSANNVCNQMAKCSEMIGRYSDVPLFLIDMPFISGNIGTHTIGYIRYQLKNLIRDLEMFTGEAFDQGRLLEACYYAELSRLKWREILELCKHTPAPISALDLFAHMLPLSLLRGSGDVVRFYDLLKHEIQNRVDAREEVIPEEKHRLGWDHLPIYHKTRYLAKAFGRYGGVFVGATFLDVTASDLPTYRGFESYADMERSGSIDFTRLSLGEILDLIATEYGMLYVNRDLGYREKRLSMLVEQYGMDGFVFHLNRGCKSQSLYQYKLKEMLSKKMGIKSLLIDGDSMDPRFFSEKQVTTRIEAFMESLEQKG